METEQESKDIARTDQIEDIKLGMTETSLIELPKTKPSSELTRKKVDGRKRSTIKNITPEIRAITEMEGFGRPDQMEGLRLDMTETGRTRPPEIKSTSKRTKKKTAGKIELTEKSLSHGVRKDEKDNLKPEITETGISKSPKIKSPLGTDKMKIIGKTGSTEKSISRGKITSKREDVIYETGPKDNLGTEIAEITRSRSPELKSTEGKKKTKKRSTKKSLSHEIESKSEKEGFTSKNVKDNLKPEVPKTSIIRSFERNVSSEKPRAETRRRNESPERSHFPETKISSEKVRSKNSFTSKSLENGASVEEIKENSETFFGSYKPDKIEDEDKDYTTRGLRLPESKTLAGNTLSERQSDQNISIESNTRSQSPIELSSKEKLNYIFNGYSINESEKNKRDGTLSTEDRASTKRLRSEQKGYQKDESEQETRVKSRSLAGRRIPSEAMQTDKNYLREEDDRNDRLKARREENGVKIRSEPYKYIENTSGSFIATESRSPVFGSTLKSYDNPKLEEEIKIGSEASKMPKTKTESSIERFELAKKGRLSETMKSERSDSITDDDGTSGLKGGKKAKRVDIHAEPYQYIVHTPGNYFAIGSKPSVNSSFSKKMEDERDVHNAADLTSEIPGDKTSKELLKIEKAPFKNRKKSTDIFSVGSEYEDKKRSSERLRAEKGNLNKVDETPGLSRDKMSTERISHEDETLDIIDDMQDTIERFKTTAKRDSSEKISSERGIFNIPGIVPGSSPEDRTSTDGMDSESESFKYGHLRHIDKTSGSKHYTKKSEIPEKIRAETDIFATANKTPGLHRHIELTEDMDSEKKAFKYMDHTPGSVLTHQKRRPKKVPFSEAGIHSKSPRAKKSARGIQLARGKGYLQFGKMKTTKGSQSPGKKLSSKALKTGMNITVANAKATDTKDSEREIEPPTSRMDFIRESAEKVRESATLVI